MAASFVVLFKKTNSMQYKIHYSTFLSTILSSVPLVANWEQRFSIARAVLIVGHYNGGRIPSGLQHTGYTCRGSGDPCLLQGSVVVRLLLDKKNPCEDQTRGGTDNPHRVSPALIRGQNRGRKKYANKYKTLAI